MRRLKKNPQKMLQQMRIQIWHPWQENWRLKKMMKMNFAHSTPPSLKRYTHSELHTHTHLLGAPPTIRTLLADKNHLFGIFIVKFATKL